VIRSVRDRYVREGKESDEEIYEPVVMPPKRRSNPAPAPERRERRERREDAPRRRREKTPEKL